METKVLHVMSRLQQDHLGEDGGHFFLLYFYAWAVGSSYQFVTLGN